jgi:ABC-type multidrug transport system ATPase subunit
MDSFTIGSSSSNKYSINSSNIDTTHLLVQALSSAEYIIRDISLNHPHQFIVNRKNVKLARIDRYTQLQIADIHFTLDGLFEGEKIILDKNEKSNYPKKYSLESGKEYFVGASSESDIILSSPKVDWRALKIQVNKRNDYAVVLVNSRKKLSLSSGDSLQIGIYVLSFKDKGIVDISIPEKGRITLRDIEVVNPFKKNHLLIKSLSLSISSGKFIGIIGPSGAGKSTLLKAIRLMLPLANGSISLSGKNLSKHPDLLSEIGFVPQDDVVITELTVKENLQYAASLRLPKDWTDEGREEKVNALIKSMRLTEQQHNLGTKISGGQRKRLNLALELLMEPTFLLADEVCSGLSALDSDNILKYLRGLRDQGMGIVLTIHSPDIEAFDLMDDLLVLDQGGIIAYYGPTSEAISYFTKTNGKNSPYQSPKIIFDILEKAENLDSEKRRTSPEEWGLNYKLSPLYHHYIKSEIDKENQHHG